MNQASTSERSGKSLALDFLLVLLLLAVALAVRWPYLQAVTFPPSDESALHLTVAENIVTGRGLVIDVLGSYRLLPTAGVPRPSHIHWTPLTTGLVAATYAAQQALADTLDTSFALAQRPGLVLGLLLVLLTYLFGRRVLPGGRHNRWMALVAALLVALNGTLSHQAASADSSAPFAFLAAWALVTAVRPPGERGSYFGTGLLLGLVYLTRIDGLLLFVAVPLAWWLLPPFKRSVVELPDNPAAEAAWELWPMQRGEEEAAQRALGPSLANVLDLLVAFALVAGPWLVRNYLAFGTPLPGAVLGQAWLADPAEFFNYQAPVTWQTLLDQGWPAILAQRLAALRHEGAILWLGTFPWGLLALPGLWLLRSEWAFWPPLIYGLLLFLVAALIFPVLALTGAFYNMFGAIVPFLAVAAAYALQRGLRRLLRARRLWQAGLAIAAAGLAVLAAVQAFLGLQQVRDENQARSAQFEMAASWLGQHTAPGDMLMATQPYPLHYASGNPCIALPAAEPPESALQAAQRYGARYLVLTEALGRYPETLRAQPDPRFRLLAEEGTTEIYAIEGGGP